MLWSQKQQNILTTNKNILHTNTLGKVHSFNKVLLITIIIELNICYLELTIVLVC